VEFTSKQLADLVGVTVRALRHYHQIGLLEEPERTYSGYRVYQAAHVLRLLRIKRLTGLGLTLEQVAQVLNHPEGTAAQDTLDTLDQALADQIEDLQTQRQAIAEIRQSQASLDVLPKFAQHLSTLRSLGSTEEALKAEKMLFEVVAGLGTQQDSEQLQQMLEAITTNPLAQRLAQLDTIMAEISPDMAEEQIDSLVAQFSQVLADFYDEYSEDGSLPKWESSIPIDQILQALVEENLNPQQLKFLQRLAAAFAEHRAVSAAE
jgi:DNA-binding transcriptional MerR regulator